LPVGFAAVLLGALLAWGLRLVGYAYVLTPEGVQNHFGFMAAPGFAAGYGYRAGGRVTRR
jgi:hypothetical protein